MSCVPSAMDKGELGRSAGAMDDTGRVSRSAGYAVGGGGGGAESVAAVPAPEIDAMTADERTAALTADLFGKIGALLEGELQKGGEDFVLLEQMNLVTTAKYRCVSSVGCVLLADRCHPVPHPAFAFLFARREMAQYASGLMAILDKLREKRVEIQPSLDAIDKVEESVGQLEQIAGQLDECVSPPAAASSVSSLTFARRQR